MTLNNRPTSTPIKIAVPLFQHMIATSITLPLEMLEAASVYSRLEGNHNPLEITFCSDTSDKIRATGGIFLASDTLYPNTGKADLVLVPALWRNPLTEITKNNRLISWLIKQHSNNALILVAGTGVVFLAEAGLLNKQPAATHWFYLDKLQRRYPAVNFKPHHLITRSGRIYCAGSVNSVADLAVHVIKVIMGSSVALRVEQQFSHEIRKSFEETCFPQDDNSNHHDEAIVLLQEWLNNHYQDNILLSDMSRVSGLHIRSLGRRFKQATSLPPASYLKNIRLQKSQELLKSSNLCIAEIALSIGYDDPNYFSRSFYKQYHLTPSNFRKSVREKLFSL
ncbi:MAG: helix-turn-helix domain-containing protein [Candidatus Endonucleobacter bathymodioli]|uniref:Helix-turn-helix domain-containing protein n=1 Tax=Candidatus Endonucleibacter bathymodioli TaxID=539814 RepID=A0AA90NVV8_9GAMM|nr:helix-turn-helix domain-containing protein [Candidatus Endonucleobacter bathymodioli]